MLRKSLVVSALVVVMTLLTGLRASGQDYFTKGSNLFTATIGYGFGYGTLLCPPVSLSYERGVADFGRGGSLGVGGEFGIAQNYCWNLCYNAYADYHYQLGTIELHARAGLGDQCSTKDGITGHSFCYIGYVGAAYFFTNSFGVMLEAGYGSISAIRGGVALRF